MLRYAIQRVFLMIPTLLFIAVVIFAVLNLAPGRPGQTQVGADGMQSSQSAESRESFRIFKEQFNFDKPVLFNTRYGLDEADVARELGVIADYQAPTCAEGAPVADGCVPAAGKPSSNELVETIELLEDWGTYAVPGLYAVAADASDLRLRTLAVNYLAQNTQARLISPYGKELGPAERAFNDEVQRENQEKKGWTVEPGAEAAAVDAVVADHWTPWWSAHASEYDYGLGEKVAIFFGDTRFAKYMSNLARFDFGVSHVDKRPVLETIGEKLKYSVTLSFLAIFLSYLISVPLGVWSAYRQGSKADQVVTVLLFMLYSLPSFFVAVVLLQLLTIGEPVQIFPTGGFIGENSEDMTALESLRSIAWHLVLPVTCMTYRGLASLSRYARTGVLDVIRADYIRTARAKGLSEPVVIIKHAVRNGMIPILTLLGSLLPVLIGGSVIIEVIFNIPGIGLYLFESILARDYNAIMAVLLISSLLTLVGLLISDLSYAVVDPRISFD